MGSGACAAAAAFRVAAFRFFVFAARLLDAFSFRFRTAFFLADILPLGMGTPFASSRCWVTPAPASR